MENSKNSKNNLVQVIMNDSQINEVIIHNIIKMFINRNIINNKHLDAYTSLGFTNIDQNEETFIDLDQEESKLLGSDKLRIKFINRKLTTIRKVIDIEEFMDSSDYKIVVVSSIYPKAEKQIISYKNTELFHNTDLLINLIDHVLIPKHFKLSEIEIEQLKNSYNIKLKNAKRMFIDDPVARYYNLKVNDVVRIERPSINSGIAIDYRVVVPGSIK